MGAIRGAICCENTSSSIGSKAVELVGAILDVNKISANDVEAVFFTVTQDLNACYPAKAVREQLNMPNIAFMCAQEMNVSVSLEHCIRVCVFAPKLSQKRCKHCYLGEAKSLRIDLSGRID